MSDRQVMISAPAALRETTALAEHYRNRNLILAEQLAQAGDKIAALEAELAAASSRPTLRRRQMRGRIGDGYREHLQHGHGLH